MRATDWDDPPDRDNQQERQHRRFHVECPVYITVWASNSVTEVETISKNVSIDGLLVKSAAMIPQHTPVTFIMRVQGKHAARPVHFVGEGKIVRVENDGAAFAIAIKCTIPLTALERHLAEV